MKSTDQAYSDDLLLALRLRDVPGTRIGEVLAEVQSHVAETGEDPRQAFGEPKQYADEVAEALGLQRGRGWRHLLTGLTWAHLVVTVVIGVASFLLADSLWALGAGEDAAFGVPAGLMAAGAVVVLAACAAWVVATSRREPDDTVRDPRTGEDMARISRWQLAVLVGAPALAFTLMLLGGLLTR
ncbi:MULTISPECIES: HAAS signaling domain-containing protein [unclassified Modestobacter]|uniref:HAAS signaling domain-containing protein n=1 Tax=unclassified Modestobacter TaxID=2643866 RepID=UPI0022AAC1E3|nr:MULTISPECIES: hypothetical protein [unclassified Modestobacter]MCZ2823048.1 hypothetical protein [Modestobacter sp. VKM Ac-2981]MCZ2851294.1 hypothetical protein [Modestobacter sp. VKM Ac-2982]